MAHPRLIFGAMTVGSSFATVEEVTSLLQVLKNLGIKYIDTAPVYPIQSTGACEPLLGRADVQGKGFTIDTKVDVTGPIKGSLREAAIDASLKKSLRCLGVPKLDVYYAHFPDPETPAEETAAAFDKHYRSGAFSKLGLSNYSTKQVQEYLGVCEKGGYVKPTLYQGAYNVITRLAEENLFPLLRKHGMSFAAFSPLAGGFLTGHVSLKADLKGTRYEETNKFGNNFRAIYDKPKLHDAIRELHSVCQSNSVTLAEVSLRWLVYHSKLRKEDAVILGASKISQIESNIKDIRQGPLSEQLLKAVEELAAVSLEMMRGSPYGPD
ncbi:MAG: hypothetical protein FRX48_06044 [Lasallia pustulata]|uniref:NADP-dependent oxidoreductase domain-containing protein n=1 Tax=Lasallia pustulata TaxID=136370 RepID=A0A5M8PQ13_9LECA|nr:MAG: hypothetical protein FRX48_06044 [Lasallia pustulata]